MPVSENESTAKAASMGLGVDMIGNPISGTVFPEAAVFGGGITSTSSGQFNQLFVSGKIDTASASGNLTFLVATSGGATGGSGFSGIFLSAPQGFIPVIISGIIARIPFFN